MPASALKSMRMSSSMSLPMARVMRRLLSKHGHSTNMRGGRGTWRSRGQATSTQPYQCSLPLWGHQPIAQGCVQHFLKMSMWSKIWKKWRSKMRTILITGASGGLAQEMVKLLPEDRLILRQKSRKTGKALYSWCYIALMLTNCMDIVWVKVNLEKLIFLLIFLKWFAKNCSISSSIRCRPNKEPDRHPYLHRRRGDRLVRWLPGPQYIIWRLALKKRAGHLLVH